MANNGMVRIVPLGRRADGSEENILLRRRRHVFVLIPPIATIATLSIILIAGVLFTFMQVFDLLFIGISLSLVIAAIALSLVIKAIVDWYFHFYILTDRRILEIAYQPLFSDKVNNIILNQVKSTEIVVEQNGIVNKIFNKGNVIITFDRPTHEDEFIFYDLKNPKNVGFLLADALDLITTANDKNNGNAKFTWYKGRDEKKQFYMTEEIFPGRTEVN